MQRKGTIGFLLFYFSFIAFIVFIIGLGGPEIFISDSLDGLVEPPSETNPVCDVNHEDFSEIKCGFENLKFFFRLLALGSSHAWITTLIITPLTAVALWKIIALIRGVES